MKLQNLNLALAKTKQFIVKLPWRRLTVFGAGEKECGLTLHKGLTVLAITGANVSLY